jgi:hypothetical protein
MSTGFLTAENSISMYRGTSKILSLTVTDSSGDPYDLTGATIWFSLKKKVSDSVPLIQKRSDNPAQAAITSAKGGLAEVYLIPSDTYDLDVRDYVFDVWVVTVGGDRYLVVGPATFTLEYTVTRIA